MKAAVDYVFDCGAKPFIVPAMGSHGGATAQGQKDVLHKYGIETWLFRSGKLYFPSGCYKEVAKEIEKRVEARAFI